MSTLQPYRRLNKFLEKEAFEPTLGWGIRMAIVLVVPLIWGIATDHQAAGEWIGLTAESICWVELKGSYSQRLRILIGGAFLAFLFALLGSFTAPYLWASVGAMLIVGFISGLFKNLGDRGSALSICVYVMFIIANASPPKDPEALRQRMEWVAMGGAWNVLVSMVATAFMPEQQPYRRSIALIWKAIAGLIGAVSKGWDGKELRSSIRDVYLKEKEVRAAIDSSLHFYESMAHQVSKKQHKEFQLAQLRKATSLVAAHIIAMSEEMEGFDIRRMESGVRLKLYALNKALQQTVERMAVYVVTLLPEEELLLESRIERLNKLIQLLREYHHTDEDIANRVNRMIQLTERTIRLIERSMERLEELGEEKPVYHSYSLLKTLFILHPRHWLRNLRLLLDFNTFTTRYALRTAVAATLSLFIVKWLKIDHGYWFPFTVIIVIQPYFGATYKKAIDRIIGTLLGVIVGSLLLRVPAGLHLKEIMLFLCSIFMVYYIRKKYAVAAFFITLSLVLLFATGDDLTPTLIYTRALCTIGGAAMAVLAGFALLPTWDKKQLPRHLGRAIAGNYRYFEITFCRDENAAISWTRYKRGAETRNSNAFDSFNRYMQEPSIRKKAYALYYQLITHNVRLTRELNNINIEQDSRETPDTSPSPEQTERVRECLRWFNKAMMMVHERGLEKEVRLIPADDTFALPYPLTVHQLVYVDKMIIELKAMGRDLEKLSEKGLSLLK